MNDGKRCGNIISSSGNLLLGLGILLLGVSANRYVSRMSHTVKIECGKEDLGRKEGPLRESSAEPIPTPRYDALNLSGPVTRESPEVVLQIPVGRILLLKNDRGMGAIKPMEVTSAYRMAYEWHYYERGEQGRILPESYTHGKASVYEKYERRVKSGRVHLVDAGGREQITCGDFSFRWSFPYWIYVPKRQPGENGIAIAFTDKTSVADIDFDRKDRKWLSWQMGCSRE